MCLVAKVPMRATLLAAALVQLALCGSRRRPPGGHVALAGSSVSSAMASGSRCLGHFLKTTCPCPLYGRLACSGKSMASMMPCQYARDQFFHRDSVSCLRRLPASVLSMSSIRLEMDSWAAFSQACRASSSWWSGTNDWGLQCLHTSALALLCLTAA